MSEPTPAELAAAGLVAITGQSEINAAIANGHLIYAVSGWQTPPPPPPTQTFTAKQVGTSQVQVAWAGFSPVKIGRNGVDSSGTGPWSTATLVGEPTTGTFTFNSLVAGSMYTLTATKADGTTMTAVVIMTGGTVTPPPVVTPPPSGAYPLGIAPAALSAGESTIFFDDFTGPLNTSDWGVYNGTSQPSSGRFVTKNTTVSGGELNLEMDVDTVDGTAVNNYEVGAGVQLVSHTLQPGELVEFSFENKPIPGAYQIGLLFAADNVWPGHGEIDILEQDDGGNFQSTVIWGSSPSSRQQTQHPVPTVGPGAHTMALAWTTDGHLVFYLDGNVYWNFPTPAAPFGAAGLNFCLQTQQESVFNTPGQTSDEIVDWVRLVKLA
jgi:hypothetical protein